MAIDLVALVQHLREWKSVTDAEIADIFFGDTDYSNRRRVQRAMAHLQAREIIHFDRHGADDIETYNEIEVTERGECWYWLRLVVETSRNDDSIADDLLEYQAGRFWRGANRPPSRRTVDEVLAIRRDLMYRGAINTDNPWPVSKVEMEVFGWTHPAPQVTQEITHGIRAETINAGGDVAGQRVDGDVVGENAKVVKASGVLSKATTAEASGPGATATIEGDAGFGEAMKHIGRGLRALFRWFLGLFK